MKVNAVMGRGTKKDFIDIYFLLQHYSFEQLMQFYLEKYADGSEYRALLSMTYFDDADLQPIPYMFSDVTWESIKRKDFTGGGEIHPAKQLARSFAKRII